MGTNCAPHLANIFLHMYEKHFIENHIAANGKDSFTLSKLTSVFRYQDDLITFEDNGMFGKVFGSIYPKEMILKHTNINDTEANYLDLNIAVVDNKYIYQLFDKRNDFNFQVINFPNLSANIPRKPAYGVFISQLVRYTSINHNIEGFTRDTKNLFTKLLKQKYNRGKLVCKFLQFGKRYPHLWTKFGQDILNHKFIQDAFTVG